MHQAKVVSACACNDRDNEACNDLPQECHVLMLESPVELFSNGGRRGIWIYMILPTIMYGIVLRKEISVGST